MRHTSDVITDILADPTLTDDAREAIREGMWRPLAYCGCERCWRHFDALPASAAERGPQPMETKG
jgi:hypothetical protein